LAIRTHVLSLQLQVATETHSPCIHAGWTFCEQGTPGAELDDPPPEGPPPEAPPPGAPLLELLDGLRHGTSALVPHVSPAGHTAPLPWWQQTSVEFTHVSSHSVSPAGHSSGAAPLDPAQVT
jgi:hypothetical protein